MCRQLQEPVASHCLPNDPKVLRIKVAAGCVQDLARIGKAREGVEASIQFKVSVRRVEIGMVENIERVGLEFQSIALPKLEILEERKIKSSLEGGAKRCDLFRRSRFRRCRKLSFLRW